jgi:hypothetical protein
MRLVINTGFFNSFFDRADTFFRSTVTTLSTRRVISQLENVRNQTNNLSAGGPNRLGGTLDIIQARINRENARLEAIGVVVSRARDFRRLAIDVDRSVEQDMQQLHGAFFEVHRWARPIEDSGEDRQGFFARLWGRISGAGSWVIDRGRGAWDWITDRGRGAWNWVTDRGRDTWNWMTDRGRDAWDWVTGSPGAIQHLKNIRSALPGFISSPLSRAELIMTDGGPRGWDFASYTWGSVNSFIRKGGPLKNPVGWGLGVISDSIRLSIDSFRQNRATTDYSLRGIGSTLWYGIRNPREFGRALSGSVDEVIKAIKFW